MKTMDESCWIWRPWSPFCYKIIHIMYIRIEEYVDDFDKEVDACIELVMNLSITENSDITARINHGPV